MIQGSFSLKFQCLKKDPVFVAVTPDSDASAASETSGWCRPTFCFYFGCLAESKKEKSDKDHKQAQLQVS